MGVVMATIALLLTATLITEGAGMLFHVLLQDRNEQTTCFDLFISSFERDRHASMNIWPILTAMSPSGNPGR